MNDIRFAITIAGLKLYTSELLTDSVQVEEVTQLSFWQRWLEPISTVDNFIAMPWEPWIKSRTRVVTKQVPSKSMIQLPYGFVVHPAMLQEVMNKLWKDVL